MAKQIKYGRYLHGGDYNPEQWLDRPDILQKDIEYFKKAHINTVSVGIFSWAVLEPEEGKYNFDWMEEIINNLYKEGIHTILATPSSAFLSSITVSPSLERVIFTVPLPQVFVLISSAAALKVSSGIARI